MISSSRVLLAALFCTGLALSGCAVLSTPQAPPAEEPKSAKSAAAQAAGSPELPAPAPVTVSPNRPQGGTLRLGLAHEPLSLDPALAVDHESIVVCENVFDTLVRYADGSTEIQPGLAESWEFTKDELTWVFTLRAGVKFHDATPVTAEAVAFSFQRQLDPNHPNKPTDPVFGKRLLSAVREVRVLDPRRVAIELSRPYGALLATLAMPQCGIVSPEAVRQAGAEFGKRPIGSGPFKVAGWSAGASISLSANADYWGIKPALAGAEIRAVPDPAARLLQMVRGDLDAMEQILAEDIEFAQRKQLVVERAPGLNVVYLSFNTDPAPAASAATTATTFLGEEIPDVSPLRERARAGLRSARIRKALARGIDKMVICTQVYGGLAIPATVPMPPTLWGQNKELKDYGYDPIIGRQLLEQAGYATDFSIELLTLDSPRTYLPQPRKLAHAVRQGLEKLGVDVRVRVLPFERYQELVQYGDYEAAIAGWTGDVGDPDNFLYTLLSPDNINPPDSTNLSFFDHPLLQRSLVEAQGLSVRAGRESAYKQAQQLIHQTAPILPLVHLLDTLVTRGGRVEGLRLHPVGFRRLSLASLRS